MVSLYMDQHVPRAITIGLRLRGLDVITAFEDGAGEMNDLELIAKVADPDDLINGVIFLPLK